MLVEFNWDTHTYLDYIDKSHNIFINIDKVISLSDIKESEGQHDETKLSFNIIFSDGKDECGIEVYCYYGDSPGAFDELRDEAREVSSIHNQLYSIQRAHQYHHDYEYDPRKYRDPMRDELNKKAYYDRKDKLNEAAQILIDIDKTNKLKYINDLRNSIVEMVNQTSKEQVKDIAC